MAGSGDVKGELSCQERVLIQWDVEGEGNTYCILAYRYSVYWAFGLLLGEEFLLDQHLTVENLLGSGAYGVVCEVINQRNGSRHAVKVKTIILQRTASYSSFMY